MFDVNILPGLVATVLVPLFCATPRRRAARRSTGRVCCCSPPGWVPFSRLDEGEHDWFSNPAIVLCTASAVLGMAAFVVWELKGAKSPIVDLSVSSGATSQSAV